MVLNVTVQYGGPSFNRPSIYRRPGSHTCFVFFSSFCFFGDVAFPSTSCTIAVFSMYGEYAVRSFLPNGIFLSCDYGLDY